MAMVRPTVKDVARSVARLDELTTDRNWDDSDRQNVADNISFVIGRSVRLRKITRRDAAIILASAGASPMMIDAHAIAIAARIRANADRDGTLSAYI